MAVPRNRHSNARKNSKRAHHAKKEKNVSNCSNCGKPRLSHRLCPFCGHYGGRAVITEGQE
ncbi:50S ribosomal protein L32 [Simkania negevensis]|uniref:50S ribosomal protein L32 n=1 Tax=Simkania negevensis TaxID=83561 RepID=UPI0009AC15B8|nr:50S ribosomal protein L32 [Simkania negevensis]MCB1067246.1 50S ribosomal protein L32 [Simkania sp.]MCB1073943.1 50S ribosomal protein L32 [Simkania sp.]MCP5490875.1 50S ribosomal protein L32 [Chlamydiales bacterium]